MVEKKLFCKLKDGREVHSFRITNCKGESVLLLDYGASIQEINVLGRNGRMGDVVLGAEPEHLEECTYEGGTIGRCANRIAFGRYENNGEVIQLEQNLFGHFLHGASGNYAKKIFRGKIENGNTVVFTYHDSGEGGWKCGADVRFFFSFDDDSALTLFFEMEGDDTTILNPTNHAYFNLSADEDMDVRGFLLKIDSDKIVTRDELGLPDGGETSAIGTPADFTEERSIKEAMLSHPEKYFQKKLPSYDEFYLLNNNRKFMHAASLTDSLTGRKMDVFSDMPCLVLFCNGDRKPEKGKRGRIYEGYCGIALETGFVPNAVNCPKYDSPLFQKGEKLTTKTVYQFSVLE